MSSIQNYRAWLNVCIYWHLRDTRSVLKRTLKSLYLEIFFSNICWLHHHHHHVTLVARISLTLSRHSSLSFIAPGRSSGQHPVSSHSCWMYVRAAFARPCVGGPKSTSLMSSSLMSSCLFQMYHHYVRGKQPCPGFWTRVIVSISYDDNRYTMSENVIRFFWRSIFGIRCKLTVFKYLRKEGQKNMI